MHGTICGIHKYFDIFHREFSSEMAYWSTCSELDVALFWVVPHAFLQLVTADREGDYLQPRWFSSSLTDHFYFSSIPVISI